MDRKRALAVLFAGLLVAGGIGVAQADPGPNGNNNHGLCTAYFNGEKNGWDKRDDPPPPFKALEDAAAENSQTVAEFCEGMIGGRPSNRG